MGRAIVRDPQVFLFDEPLSNLDAKLRVAMRVEIKELHQRLEHHDHLRHPRPDRGDDHGRQDRRDAATAASSRSARRSISTTGRRNVFVAGFIGSPAMNFIKGKIDSSDGGQIFVSDTGSVLPVDGVNAQPGQPAIYGIRPEHIEIAPDGLPATVSVLEPTGSETQIFARLGDDPIDAIVKERLKVRPGEQIGFRIDPGMAHIFDRQSGARL